MVGGFIGQFIATAVGGGKSFGYMPCPKCVKENNIVEVKVCDIDQCPRHFYARRIRDEALSGKTSNT